MGLEDHADTIRTAAEGRTLFTPPGCGEPPGLLELLASGGYDRAPRVVVGLSLTLAEVLRRHPDTQVRFATWHPFGDVETPLASGLLEFLPWRFSDVPSQLALSSWAPDVAVMQVAPPGLDGSCSLGAAVSLVPLVAAGAEERWALFNREVPDVVGEAARLPLDAFSRRWEADAALIAYHSGRPGKIDEEEHRIAEHVASVAPDRPVLQVGIGAIPDAVCKGLAGTGAIPFVLLTDSGRLLLEAPGAPDHAEFAEAMGGQDLLRWLHRNDRVRMISSDRSHSVELLRSLDRLVAVNSAFEVDLTGQVAAESIGRRQVSGAGGQLDFMLGAHLNPRGLSIIALRSTAAGGRTSRVVRSLRSGTVVTTPRTAVDVVITEQGVADLRGATCRERRERLTAIAHPAFRKALCDDEE